MPDHEKSALARKFISSASVLAEISGRILCRGFVKSAIAVEEKADRTIVTASDRDAETQMRDYLSRTFPDHGIVGEEFGSERPDAEFVWYLDPIDGTISFVTGVPLFGTLIGLCYQGTPILGVINQPILNQLCIGTSTHTTLNGKSIRVGKTNKIYDATLLTTDFSHISKHQDPESFQALHCQVKQARTWGDCYGYLLVASGRADIMLDPIMKVWDLMPLIPIIQGAGGVITDWSGQSPVGASSCIASNQTLHSQVLETLHPASKAERIINKSR